MVEYNRHKKEELKCLNEHITKKDDMIEQKSKDLNNNYLYISGASVVRLAIVGCLLYDKFKKPDVPSPSNVSNVNTKIEPKRDIF